MVATLQVLLLLLVKPQPILINVHIALCLWFVAWLVVISKISGV